MVSDSLIASLSITHSLDSGTNYSKKSETDNLQLATIIDIKSLTEPGYLVWSWELQKCLPLENEELLISATITPCQVTWSSLHLHSAQTPAHHCKILGWPKSLFKIFHNIFWKNLNDFFWQPNNTRKREWWSKRTDVNFCRYEFVGLMEELREFPMRILTLFWGQGLGWEGRSGFRGLRRVEKF